MLAHLCGPRLALSRRTKEGLRQFLDIEVGMVGGDNPYPHEGAPGTLWIMHIFQYVVVIVTGVVAVGADRDQAEAWRVDLLQDVLDQSRQLRGQRCLA